MDIRELLVLMLILLSVLTISAQPINLDAPVNFTTLNESVMAEVLDSVASGDDLSGGLYDGDYIAVGDHEVSIDHWDYYSPVQNESFAELKDRVNATYVRLVSHDRLISRTESYMLIRTHSVAFYEKDVVIRTTHMLILLDDNTTYRMLHSTLDDSLYTSFSNRGRAHLGWSGE